MKRLLLILITFTACGQERNVHLTDKVDPDIVIINIEDGDRAFIGKVLLTIDSCKPKLVAIDAWFVAEKDSYQDSVLMAALRLVNNDVLGYALDSIGRPVKSHDKFRRYASAEGLAVLDNIDGVSSHITPIRIIDNEKHELFPLAIVKKWRSDFVKKFNEGETIPINFTRTVDQYVHFNGSSLTTRKNIKDLKDKIVLLGYLGPSNEDKHFTPVGQVIKHKQEEPDMYGVVVIANEIRTILND